MSEKIRSAVEALELRRLFAMPTLVADLNQTTDQLGVEPNSTVQSGNVAYFAGRPNAADGFELFKTDGTTPGTVLVKDINPAGVGSAPDALTDVNGTLYFTADDGVHGRELWKSDGTANGTTMVADLAAGTASSTIGNLTNVNGALYFTASGNLYRTDGTAPGTMPVTNGTSPLSNVRDLAAYNGSLLVSAGYSYNLYKVDGTNGSLVTSAIGSTRYLKAFNGYVYFTATGYTTYGDTNKGDLFRTDGTAAGTTLVKPINYLSGSTDYAGIGPMTVSGDRLYFVAGNATSGAYNLWATDGTNAGTLQLTTTGNFYPLDTLAPVGTRSVLFTNTTTATGTEPWVSDGTTAGTRLLKDANPGTGLSDFGGAARLANGRTLLVTTSVFGGLSTLYSTDGTPAGTSSFASLSAPGEVFVAGQVNGVALLVPLRTFGQGDLFRSDGTASGTVRVGATLAANGSSLGDYNPSGGNTTLAVGNTVYFVADNGNTGYELWKTVDGQTPTLVYNGLTANGDGYPSDLTAAPDGSLYFTAGGPPGGGFTRNVFRYGTTANGSTAVVYAGILKSGESARNLVAVGTQLFYTVSGGTLARPELRSYDSATNTGGTVRTGGLSFVSPTTLVRVGPYAYFAARRADVNGNLTGDGLQIYRIADGSGTPELVTGVPGGFSSVQSLGANNDTFYFAAATSASGTELWKTDGTPNGASLVLDATPGTAGSDFSGNTSNPTTSDGVNFYYSVYDASGYLVAYRTDGTAGGTRPVDASIGQGFGFVRANGGVYFNGTDANGVYGLYRADDTGATLVGPGGTGDDRFTAGRLLAAGGDVYAFGYGGDKARWELWQYKTASGTFAKVADLGPRTAGDLYGPLTSYFGFGRYGIAATDSDLYFPMYEEATGVELHKLALSDATTLRGVVFNDVDLDGVRDPGETGAGGVRVFLDSNNNGLADGGERLLTTNADGAWFFDVSQPGVYTVRAQTPTDGRRFTTASSVTATAAAGQTVAAGDFGVTNAPPTAVIGGPKTVAEGASIALDGTASSEPFGTVAKYEWDFNYDGTTFDVDTTGPTPTFDASSIDGPATRVVGLRVSDANGLVSFVTKTVITITNAPPVGRIEASTAAGTVGLAVAFFFPGATDPAVADRNGLTYGYDYNNDGDFTDSGETNDARPSAGYAFATPGTYVVHGRLTDKDGTFRDSYTTVLVSPPATATTPTATTVEAETGTFAGGTAKASGNAGYTGTGYADFGGQNSSAQWTIDRATGGGTATISFRYANGGTVDRPLAIYVNDTLVGTLAFGPTGGWSTWASTALTVNLAGGANTIKAVATATIGGANVDSFTVSGQTPAWISAAANATYSLTGDTLTVLTGTVTLTADAGSFIPGLNVAVRDGTRLVFNTSQHLGTLAVDGRATMAGGQVLKVTNLGVGINGGLDLGNSDLLLDYTGTTPLAGTIRDWVGIARSGGTWTGRGITSNAAAADAARTLLVLDSTAYGGPSFDGEPLDGTAVLIKSTYAGDTNADGRVDFNDFLSLQNAFGTSVTPGTAGDANLDGRVDFNDFLALQNNFGKSVPTVAGKKK